MCAAKPDAHAHVAEGVLENEVPADDPRDQFAHGGVGVGVGRAGDGNHRRELGIAEAGERADDGDQHQRKRQRRTRAGPPGHGGVQDEVVDERRVLDRGRVEVLPGHRRADDGEDARSDDCANAEGGERPRPEGLFQRVLRLLELRGEACRSICGQTVG